MPDEPPEVTVEKLLEWGKVPEKEQPSWTS
jgi:hypothetical protein